MTTLVDVVAAVISRHGRYLLCKRPSGKRHGGLFEFPGGKVAPGESLAEAVARELDEELGVSVQSVGRTLFTRHDPNSPFCIHFIEVDITGEPAALEHEMLEWALVGEMRALPLAPSDSVFVEAVLDSSAAN